MAQMSLATNGGLFEHQYVMVIKAAASVCAGNRHTSYKEQGSQELCQWKYKA